MSLHCSTHWFAALVFLVLAAVLPIYSAEVVYQRCLDPSIQRDGDNATFLSGLLAAVCETCDSNPLNSTNTSKASLHVAIPITTPNPQPELFSVASGLLKHDIYVTVFYVAFPASILSASDYGNVLRRRILSGVHCSYVQEASAKLTIQPVEVASDVAKTCIRTTKNQYYLSNPFQYCFVAVAASQYRSIQGYFLTRANNTLPNLILTEFQGFGAVFFAERHGIPSFILTDERTLNDTPGYAQNKYSGWSFWRQYLFPNGIIQSLASSRFFMDLNTIRYSAAIPTKYSIGDFWDSVTGIFVLKDLPSSPSISKGSDKPPLIYLGAPLLPSWVPCQMAIGANEYQEEAIPKDKPDTVSIIVIPPVDMVASQSREILRGLMLARRSLDTHEDVCPFGSALCWSKQIEMRVKWMADAEAFNYPYLAQDPLPAFVRKRNLTLLYDDLLNSLSDENNYGSKERNSLIVVARCDGYARPALLLQIPVLCLPSYSSNKPLNIGKLGNENVEILERIEAKSVGSKILKLVWRTQKTPQASTTVNLVDHKGVSSLQHVIAAIRLAMQLSLTLKSTQNSATPDYGILQRSFSAALNTKELEGTSQALEASMPFHFRISMCFSILVLAFCAAYLTSKKGSASRTRYFRLPKMFRNHLCNLLLSRLPELEEAWEAFSTGWDATNPPPPLSKTSSEKQRRTDKVRSKSSGTGTVSQPKKRSGKHR